MQEPLLETHDKRSTIAHTLDHLGHVLPGQAPILDFVHHNTLHGFQHLPFEEALAEFERMTGVFGYLPESKNRDFYRQGRIKPQDIDAAFAHHTELQAEHLVCSIKNKTIYRKDLYRLALLHDFKPVTVSQLNWQIEELHALDTVQADVPEALAPTSGADIRQLWEAILTKLDLEQAALHPETMLDLSIEQAEEWLLKIQQEAPVHQAMQQEASEELDKLFQDLGNSITLRGIVLALSGIDILDCVRPLLIRLCASSMDEGLAAWQLPERSKLGLYAAWRTTAPFDAELFLHELPDWQQVMDHLPDDAIDTIIWHLEHLEIPATQWEGYLQRLALELPGWSGMIYWRQQHPHYQAPNDVHPKLADYLAIRLTLDRLWLNQVCRGIWKVDAKAGALQNYFRKNLSEFMVRQHLYRGDIPEYLTQQAKSLTHMAGSERSYRKEWRQLADLMWTWQFSPMAQSKTEHSVYNSGWRLFRLCQHLGLTANDLDLMRKTELEALLNVLNRFDETARAKVWLFAYEFHYREDFFKALRANHNRGRYATRDKQPEAQIIFCMDEREESFRRHLEELNPAIETLGAAGFFGVPINYKGLDDNKASALCPVVVIPAHNVNEVPRNPEDPDVSAHHKGKRLNQRFTAVLNHSLRHNLVVSKPIIDVLAPVTLLGLLGKSLLPMPQHKLMTKLSQWLVPKVNTQLSLTSTDTQTVATPERPKLGFTDTEQADRVAGLLRVTGLTDGFAPLVVLMGHGSISQNNPHMAAYDCGACSGRHGAPNARTFAAMANRPVVRKLLAEREIHIPERVWFIGAEHNTCNEEISWFDFCDLPLQHRAAFKKLEAELQQTRKMSAHERCRRLASAPRNPTPAEALAHIEERATDFSQARPELGHATNAAAVVGRRSLTQGIFFDRRVFLISYDPTQDPEGKVLENILLAVGPVGAGINLEYYFSTVNNERFGCGSKIPHNVTGLIAVMEGAGSDLRTGLPQQMIEIHEPMRLQLLVEAKTKVLEAIYARQPSLQELIAGGWVHLSSKDPDTGDINVFERGAGFVRWQAEAVDLPIMDTSPDCYGDQTLPVAPVLIKQPTLSRI